MATVRARNVDEALYARIEESAMKNERAVEAEIRMALAAAYPPPSAQPVEQTRRLRWQAETSERLSWLLNRLSQDGFFPGGMRQQVLTRDLVELARTHDVSPGWLMDQLDGRAEITPAFADTLAATFSASADWLLSGEGTPFAVESIDARSLEAFFLPPDTGRCSFELIHILDGEQNDTLICLRHNTVTKQVTAGEFICVRLGPDYGGNSQRELTALVRFLKQHDRSFTLMAYSWETPKALEHERITGEHHPVVFRRQGELHPADWLSEMFQGGDPYGWLSADQLKDIRETPFGTAGRSGKGE